MAAYDYINLNGLVVADTSQTKAEVQQEYIAAPGFGSDLDLSDESPEGVLINAETFARNGVAVNNAKLANQINPNFSGGVFLDAVWALTYALTGGRKEATRSTFSQPVDLTGVPGTLIPSGSKAVSVNEDQFQSLSDVTLDGSGLGAVAFQAVETGPIAVNIGDLDAIGLGSVLGWETVNNPVATTLGRNKEEDSVSRIRRKDTLALQGISVSEAITSSINNIDDVKSMSYRENYTDTDMNIDGVFLLKHSTYSCVDGGLDDDIFNELLKNKTVGANWNGAVSSNVIDPTSGQPYLVKFARPDEIQMWVRVTIAPPSISNPDDVIEQAVLDYSNGLVDGQKGFVVGGDVSTWEISGAINIESPGLFIKLVEISTDGIAYITTEIAIEIFQVARTSASQIDTIIS